MEAEVLGSRWRDTLPVRVLRLAKRGPIWQACSQMSSLLERASQLLKAASGVFHGDKGKPAVADRVTRHDAYRGEFRWDQTS